MSSSDTKCPWKRTPLLEAIKVRDLNLATLLIEEGASASIEEWNTVTCESVSPLMIAIEAGYIELATLLVNKGNAACLDIGRNNFFRGDKVRPLIAAIERGYHELAALLIAKGADVHCGRESSSTGETTTPLTAAFESGDFALAALLVERGAERTPSLRSQMGEAPVLAWKDEIFSFGEVRCWDCLANRI